MKKNVIILTSGLAGSSVLAGLISQDGYWLGHETVKKKDYDTYENKELVGFNKKLFSQLGYSGNYEMVFDANDIKHFSEPKSVIDLSEYRAFVDKCDTRSPWLWKDPRLWLSIHYWANILDLDNVKFINLSRDPFQAWVSLTIRRQIQEFSYLKAYLDGVDRTINKFLNENSAQHISLKYEDLIVEPEKTIHRLNDFLGSSLSFSDLQQVYTGELYRKPKRLKDFLKAAAIYVRNYRHRYR